MSAVKNPYLLESEWDWQIDPKAFAMKRGKQSISMYSRWRMVQEMMCFTSVIGFGSRVQQFVVVMMACAL